MKIIKLFITLFLFIVLFNISFSLTVNFDNSKVYKAGDNLVGEVSTYSEIELILNGNSEGNFIFDKNTSDLYWSSRNDISVNIGDEVTLYNDVADLNYSLILPNGSIQEFTLINGGSKILKFEQLGNYDLSDNNFNSITITVGRDMRKFNFTNLNFRDGKNKVKFNVRDLLNNSVEEFNYNITVNKYEVSISIINYTSPVNNQVDKFFLEGSVSKNNLIVLYLINKNFYNDYLESGSYKQALVSGNKFNITLDKSDLRNGNNNITIITYDSSFGFNDYVAYANGLKVVNFTADFTDPSLSIDDPRFKKYNKEQNLVFNVTTDGSYINYTFNNQNYTVQVNNGTAVISLSLVDGRNNLTLTVYDEFGNYKKDSHTIFFSNEEPKIVKLEPEDVFKNGGTSHQSIFKIEGEVNKPDVEVTAYVIPEDVDHSCEDYASFFVTTGEFDEDENSPSDSEAQSSVSLELSDLFTYKTYNAGDDKKFEGYIGLSSHKGDIDRTDNFDVEVRNKVCFILKDKFGMVNIQSYNVKLDTGNTVWKPYSPKTYPNTVYAAEIEVGESETSYSPNSGVGVTLVLNYIGEGSVTSISGLSINVDRALKNNDNDMVSVDSSRTTFYLNKETNELIIHFPLELKPKGIPPYEYPDELNFDLEARFTYSVNNELIPIDTNPVYFKVNLNVERPFDHSKWLSPETINKYIGYLNKTIKFTEKAVEFTKWGSVAGILACQGYQIWLGIQGVSGQGLSENDERRLYRLCDRVYSMAAPPKCEDKKFDNFDLTQKKTIDLSDDKNSVIKDDNGNTIGRVKSIKSYGKESCELGLGDDSKKGIKITSNAEIYSGDSRNFFGFLYNYKEKKEYERTFCVPENYLDGISNPGQLTGACYNEKPPFYDDTKCWLPGVGSGSGMDPKDNLFYSIRCGSITDTYSHLNKWLVIQNSLKKCLEEAKIGQVSGSYCERLLSQAVCDVATNFIINPLLKGKLFKSEAQTPDKNFGEYFSQVQNRVRERYGNNALARQTLDTSMIAEKACVGALTGDWSVISENLLQSLDVNQVEPTFGPLLPTSRIINFDPISGGLSIEYRFTYGVVSGGQDIRSEFYVYCDKSADYGEYCTNDLNEVKIGSRIVSKDGSAQDTIVEVIDNSRVWYNKLKVVHTYQVNGETRTKTQEETIIHKGEIPIECSFSAGTLGTGAGFSCSSLMGGSDAILGIFKLNDVDLLPKPSSVSHPVYFPGNSIYAIVDYEKLGLDTSKDTLYLGTRIVCGDLEKEGKSNEVFNVEEVKLDNFAGEVPVKIMNKVPNFGDAGTVVYNYKYNVGGRIDENYGICLESTNTETKPTVTVVKEGGNSETLTSEINKMSCSNNARFSLSGSGTLKVSSTNHNIFNLYLIPENKLNNIEDKSDVNKNELNLKPLTNTQQKVEINDITEFENLQPGVCKAEFVSMPDGSSRDIKSFEEQFNNSNFQTNVDFKKITKEIEFRLPQKDKKEFYWDILMPVNGRSYCVENLEFNGIKLPTIVASYSNIDLSDNRNYEINLVLKKKNPKTGMPECVEGCKKYNLIFNKNDNIFTNSNLKEIIEKNLNTEEGETYTEFVIEVDGVINEEKNDKIELNKKSVNFVVYKDCEEMNKKPNENEKGKDPLRQNN